MTTKLTPHSSSRRHPAFFPSRTLLALCVLSATTALSSAYAQRPEHPDGPPPDRAPGEDDREAPGARPPRRPPPHAFFDTDHDGILSAAEIDAAPERLRSLDKDGDGQLSGSELRPPRPPGPPPGEDAPDFPPPPPPQE